MRMTVANSEKFLLHLFVGDVAWSHAYHARPLTTGGLFNRASNQPACRVPGLQATQATIGIDDVLATYGLRTNTTNRVKLFSVRERVCVLGNEKDILGI